MKKKLLSIVLSLAMIFTLSSTAFAAEPIIPDSDSTPKVTVITDRSEIEAYVKENGLPEDPNNIDKIIDVETNVVLSEPSPYASTQREPEIGPEEIILKNHRTADKTGPLIRSSKYEYPGGEMTVSETVDITFSSEVGLDAEVISAKVGFDVTKGVTVSDTQYIDIPNRGQTAICTAYTKLKHHTYDVIGDDVFLDDDLGTLTIDVPVGVSFTVDY